MGRRLRASALELISFADQNSEPLCFWDLTAGCSRYLGIVFAGLILSFRERGSRVAVIRLIPMQTEHPKRPCSWDLSALLSSMGSLAFFLHGSHRTEQTWSRDTQNPPGPTVVVFYCKCKWNVEIKLSFNCVNSSSEFSSEWGKGGEKMLLWLMGKGIM